jgi:hypothetical protein
MNHLRVSFDTLLELHITQNISSTDRDTCNKQYGLGI